MEEKRKSNNELLRELQNIAEEHKKIKDEIEVLLNVLDGLEKKHDDIVNQIKGEK